MKKIVFMFTLILFFTSCSSIVHRSKQDVRISSETDSRITVKDSNGNIIAEGINSISLKLDRGDGYFIKGKYFIEVEKKGYKPVKTALTGQLNTGSYVIGNLFTYGIGWLIIDPLTGSMWTLSTPDGQKGNDVRIFLKESVTGETLDKATKIN